MTEWDEAEVERVEICSACGVSMLPPEVPGEPSTCENAGCEAWAE